MRFRRLSSAVVLAIALLPQSALARTADHARDTGVSALWILANLSYAGMRAQSNTHAGWRVLAFLFGLPGTLLTMLVVTEGSERAYGVDLPCLERSHDARVVRPEPV